jgi:hypothetical protein
MKFVITLFILTLTASCAHNEPNGAVIGTRYENSNYEALIGKFTKHSVQYEGLYNKFELNVTFINSEVQAAILQKRSDIYQWDTKLAQKEREKILQENSTQTKFALSFFVPSIRLNDLNKPTTIWKAFLESHGHRYAGRITKRNGKLEDIQATYPYHNRWSVPYEITFDVPLAGVEDAPLKFIITSSQGSASLQY